MTSQNNSAGETETPRVIEATTQELGRAAETGVCLDIQGSGLTDQKKKKKWFCSQFSLRRNQTSLVLLTILTDAR